MSADATAVAGFATWTRERRHAQIIHAADALIGAGRATPEAFRAKAAALRSLARCDEAKEVLQAGLKLFPEDPQLLLEERAATLELPFAYCGEMSEAALSDYALSIRAGTGLKRQEDPAAVTTPLVDSNRIGESAQVTAAYAQALRAKGAPEDEVLRYARLALHLDPCTEPALTLAREIHVDRFELDAARALIEAALRVNPEQHYALTELARFHLDATGDVDEMLKAARRAQELAPLFWPAVEIEIQALQFAGHYDEAIERCLRTRTGPGSAINDFYLAGLYTTANRLEEAKALIESLRDDPDVSSWYDVSVQILKKEGRLPEANVLARTGLAAAPSSHLRQTAAALFGMQRRLTEAYALLADDADAGEPWPALMHALFLGHEKRFNEALDVVDRALARHPRSIDLLSAKAWILGSRGDFAAGEEIFESVLRRPPANGTIAVLRADFLFQRGLLGEASAFAERWVKNFPDYADLHATIGQVLLENARYAEAVAAFDHAIAADTSYTTPVQLKCMALFWNKQAGEAWELVSAAQKRFPFSVGVIAVEGWLRLFEYEDDARAEMLFTKVLAEVETSVLAHFGLGAIALRRRDSMAAQKHFRRVLELQPSSPAALTNLAWSLAIGGGRNNLAAARGYCERALLIDRTNARAEACLGVIAFQLNERSAAERHLSRAVERQPGDIECSVNLAALKARIGAYKEAETLLNAVLAADPLHLRANVELSQLALKLERAADARLCAQRAIDAHPTSAGGFRAMAAAMMAANQYARAEGVLREALTTVDNDELDVIRLDYAIVLLRLGDELQNDAKYREALEQVALSSSDGATPEAYVLRGLAELKLKNPKGALQWLARAGKRRNLLPYVEEYTSAARQQLASESAQVGKLGYLAAALVVLQTGVLWGAFFGEVINDTQFAVLLPILLALLIVCAVLPNLTRLKVATVEADISRGVRNFHLENLSGPRLRVDLPPEASLVMTAKTLDV